ncbi:MAG: translation initiation factor eIF-1A [Nanoarchaeota archaeon]
MERKRYSDMSEEERAIQAQQEITRIKIPRDREIFGIVEQRCGASRMIVKCLDGKTRNCRIPGRLKRSLWVREGDVVIVEPWEYGGDAKGDIVYKYTKTQVSYLRNKGQLDKLSELEEF